MALTSGIDLRKDCYQMSRYLRNVTWRKISQISLRHLTLCSMLSLH